MEAIKVLAVPAQGRPHIEEIEPVLEEFQRLVGGYIEPVRFDGYPAFVNEEGRLKGLPPNVVASVVLNQPIVGDVVFVGPYENESVDRRTALAVAAAAGLMELKRNPIDEAIEVLRGAGFQVIPPRPDAKPRVRRDAPDTSKAIEPRLDSAAGKVLGVLRRRGALGATDDEIEVRLQLTHQSVSAARRNLVIRGLVRGSDLRRKTRSGNKATVWLAVER